jgi:PAH dioxygenase large subunit
MQQIPRTDLFTVDRSDDELDRVFRTSWLFVAHESEIPTPGSYVTRRMATDPVIVVRNPAGEVRVLRNSCAHRGTQLCRADVGVTSGFRCMYHGWTYDTDGRLRGLPGLRKWYPPDFDRAAHGLVTARAESFHGLVFATWDTDAPPLREYLGDLAFYLEALFARAEGGWEAMGEPLRWLSRTNWKVSVENFGMDSLHLAHLHAGPAKLGIFTSDGATPTAYTVVCGSGHAAAATKLPVEGGRTYPGYPEELWPGFDAALSPEQAWFVSNNLVTKGNVFPNLSFIDLVHAYTGDPEAPPVAGTMLRQVHPVDAYTSEVSMWILVPRDAPDRWKRWSQESLIRTLGVSGTFEPDDLENTTAVSAGNRGIRGRDDDLLFVAGAHLAPTEAVDGVRLPGEVYVCSINTELMQRGFFTEWYRRMESAPVRAGAS